MYLRTSSGLINEIYRLAYYYREQGAAQKAVTANRLNLDLLNLYVDSPSVP